MYSFLINGLCTVYVNILHGKCPVINGLLLHLWARVDYHILFMAFLLLLLCYFEVKKAINKRTNKFCHYGTVRVLVETQLLYS